MDREQLTALKTEITTDPLTNGYAGKSHEEIAKLLTQKNRQINSISVSTSMLVSSVVKSEYSALSAADKDYLKFICGGPETLPMTANLRTELAALFGTGTVTRTNLVAMLKRLASRCEELNLPQATTSDVADALLRT